MAAYPDRTPRDPIRATYSIDGRGGSFSIQNGGGASDFYRRVVKLFDLSNGEHTLELTFNGGIDTNDIPLTLVEFWVKEGTHPYHVAGPTSTGTDGSSSTGTATSGARSLDRLFPFLSTIGGVLVLGVLSILF